MTNKKLQLSGKQPLRPRARILRTLGDELISNDTVAVIELVKNSYDADASQILIRFHGSLQKGNGVLEIIDNGVGMALEDIQSSWLEPATLSKKRRKFSEKLKRRVLGEKGIGRFATSRLANFLEVVTRKENYSSEIRVNFDWSNFDDEQKYLDQIDVFWEETEPLEIGQSHKLKNWEFDQSNHGTVLRMRSLRTSWSRQTLSTLRIGLSRLISPFSEIDQSFSIYLDLPEEFADFSGEVRSSKTLEHPHHYIKGSVAEDGSYSLRIRIKGFDAEELISGKFALGEGRKPQCGPFEVELRVWDRDQSSLGEIADWAESTIKDVRRDLDQTSGMNIYRDGFRVLPYGENNDDWLSLDIRRVQNPTLRISNNQLVGYVSISADGNPQLRDQSNREGMMEGDALEDLRNLVRSILSELEIRRYKSRRQSDTRKKEERTGIFASVNFSAIPEFVRKKYPEDRDLIDFVEEQAEDIQQRIETVQVVLSRYQRLATLGQIIDTVIHDGRTPLVEIGQSAEIGLLDVGQLQDSEAVKDLSSRFSMILSQADLLEAVFDRIAPLGGRKRGRPVKVKLENLIAESFAIFEAEIQTHKVKVELPKTNTEFTVQPTDIQAIIINLLNNSLYWLQRVSASNRHIHVKLKKLDETRIEILFSDSGPGIEPEFSESIFEPYFSKKPDGIGLGLTIIGDIVSEYYSGSLELIKGGILSGANFRIVISKKG